MTAGKTVILLCAFFIYSFTARVSAQVALEILDRDSGEPVAFAQVCVQSLDKKLISNGIADADGKFTLHTDKRIQVAVTALGYVNLLDTIGPRTRKTLFMEATSFSMDEVVVTGQYSPRKADRSIYNVQVINRATMKEKAATNMSDLLASELNVRIGNDAVLGSSLSLQGLSGEHVKILVDGVPVIGRMDGNIDMSQINLHNVDHIELVEGPMSVVYGTNALAGALNIITKEDTRHKLSLWQRSYAESVGMYNFDAGAVARYRNHSFSITAARNFFSGHSTNDFLRSQLWKPRLQYNLDAWYVYKRERFKLRADLGYFNGTIWDKGPLLPSYYETAIDSWFRTARLTRKLTTSYDFSESKSIEAIFSYSGYSRVKNSYLKDLTDLSRTLLPDSSAQDTTEFNAFLMRGTYTDRQLAENLSYQLGYDFNLERGTGKRILDGAQQIGDYALFASFQYHSPDERFSLQPGLRYGYNTKYHSPVVPSLNVRFAPDDRVLMRFSLARGFRAPALKELYLYFKDINHDLEGNPNLKAEYSNNVNLSSEFRFRKGFHQASVKGSFFYNDIKDKITLLKTGSTTLYSYLNVDRFRAAGTRVQFRYKMHPRFSFSAGISETGINTNIEGTGDESGYRFTTDFTSSMNYNLLSRDIVFSVFYKYSGRLPQFRIEDGDILLGYIDSFHTLDVTLNKSFLSDRISLAVGGKNLFDYEEVELSGTSSGVHSSGGNYLAGWGRTWFASLKFQLNKY